MHELAIVEDLISMSERELAKNGCKIVEKLVVKIGRLSGVEPHLLKNAFEFYKTQTPCAGANLEIFIQDVVVRCKSCDEISTLSKNEFICPACGSNSLEIKDGEELFLMQVVMK